MRATLIFLVLAVAAGAISAEPALEILVRRAERESALRAHLLERITERRRLALSLSALLRGLSDRRVGGSALDRDLGEFLARPDAAHLILDRFLAARVWPDPTTTYLARWLTTTDDGRYTVAPAARESASREMVRIRGLEDRVSAAMAVRGVPWRLLRRAASGALRARPKYEDVLIAARSRAAKCSTESLLDREFRRLLSSPFVVIVMPPRKPDLSTKLPEWLLGRTPLGRALVRGQDGKFTVHPHFTAELDHLLLSLVAEGDRRLSGLRAAAESARSLFPKEDPLSPAFVLANRAERLEAGRDVERAEQEPVVPAERGLSRLTVDPEDLEFDDDRLHLFKSSVFYNPRTHAGAYWYTTQFADHDTARLFGTFEWTLKKSTDLESSLRLLAARKPGLAALGQTHRRIIIVVNSMPVWLSGSEDPGFFERGVRSNREAHGPRDLATWKKLVGGMAALYRDLEGVELYYEFWNEPDLEYWQGTHAEFLELYAATVTAIKEADPDAKVGGCAVNQWDGKVSKEAESGPLNPALIRLAGRRKLPLDFVSWHHFGRPLSALAEAKEAYEEEVRKAGLERMPEFLVTEWTTPGRGHPQAAAAYAETMVALREAGVDGQTMACWEEFHARPDPKGFAPWGIITQQGVRKNTWYAHRFFDRLARDSEGVARIHTEDAPTLLVSREADGTLEILAWRTGLAPRVAAAWDVIRVADVERQAGRFYLTGDRFDRAMETDGPALPDHEDAFREARKAWLAEPVQQEHCRIEFPGATALEILEAETVRMAHAQKPTAVEGNTLTFALRRSELVRIRIRTRGP